MAQYKTGTVSVTNGSATVTGSGTLWSGEIAAGDLFTIVGDNAWYEVASVGSNTSITLSANYAGTTGSGKSYAISRDFTTRLALPYPQKGDIETASIIKRAFEQIDTETNIATANYSATSAPTANDDSGDGYSIGSWWVNVTSDEAYLCVDATVGAAVWTKISVDVPSEIVSLLNNQSLTLGASTIQGLTVGRGAGAVSSNTAVGASALAANTTGQYNTAIGFTAAQASQTANQNTSIGYGAGRLSTAGNITAVGVFAAQATTTGVNNNAFGINSLYTNTTGSYNIAIGDGSLFSNTTASNNTAVGYQAGYGNTTGTGNLVVGYQAGLNSTTASYSVFLGRLANGAGTATANYNTGVGNASLYSLSSGISNSALGSGTLFNNTTGSNNVAIGDSTLYSNTTASNNTALGYQALYSAYALNGLTAIGYQAGYANTDGGGFTAVGYVAGKNYNSSGENYGSTFVGFYSAADGSISGHDNTSLGGYSLRSLTTGSNNIAIGGAALYSNTTAGQNTAVGYQAAYSNTTGASLVAIGYRALYSNTAGSNMVAIGDAALYTATGDANIAIGTDTARAMTTGSNNVAVGQQALRFNTTASNNTAVGYQAGYTNSTGVSNTYIGHTAGYNATGGSNTFVGVTSGSEVTSGTKNTILGRFNGNQGSLDIRTSDNYIVLSDGDGNPRGYFNSGGAFNVAGVYSNTSAAAANVGVGSDGFLYRSTSALKYKQDIRDVEDFAIDALRPVRYKSKCEGDDQTKDYLGLIADEAAEAGFEELVTRGANGEVEGFQYERLTVVLLKEIQSLRKRLADAGIA